MGKTIKLDEVPKLNHIVMDVVKSSMKKAIRELPIITANQIEVFDKFLDGLNDFEMQCFVNEVSTDSNGETSKFKMDVLMKYINCPWQKPDKKFYEKDSITIPISNKQFDEKTLSGEGIQDDIDLARTAMNSIAKSMEEHKKSNSKYYSKLCHFNNGCIVSYNIIEKMMQKSCNTPITDTLEINSTEDAEKLISLYTKDFDISKPVHNIEIPSDIFISGTVPLETMEILMCYLHNFSDGVTLEVGTHAVVYIRHDCKSRIRQKMPFGVLVHTIFIENANVTRLYLIGCSETDNYIETAPISAYFSNDSEFMERQVHHNDSFPKYAATLANNSMAVYYGSQIALLHPQVKEIIKSSDRRSSKEPIELAEDINATPKKKKAKYIRHHTIDNTAYNKIIYGGRTTEDGKPNYKRHTMSWYVIGHWRHYNDGRKIFIQPHWRGPLRQAASNTKPTKTRIFDETASE